MKLGEFIEQLKEGDEAAIKSYKCLFELFLDVDIIPAHRAVCDFVLAFGNVQMKREHTLLFEEFRRTIEILRDNEVMAKDDRETEAGLAAHVLNRVV